jgi:hypothetical protein
MDHLEFPQWVTDLPVSERPAKLLAQLDAWIRSGALKTLAQSWGGNPPLELDTSAVFQWYDEFSAKNWDFRAGRERNLAVAPELTREQTNTALEAADVIGLLHSRPPTRRSYDFVLILGGLVRACMTRPRYASELLDEGVMVGQVLALGGFRPLGGDELDLAELLGIDAHNEFGAMIAGVRAAFPRLGEPHIETSVATEPTNSDWAVAHFEGEPIQVLAAPSRVPEERRANTADTFAWWAESVPRPEGKHVLLVTNPIYVPYQGASATEKLGIPYDITVETAGISDKAADLGQHTQLFGPSNYIQETRSAIRGYKSLYSTATELANRLPQGPDQ